ncbi:PO21 protein, partial [Erpornis zantholeuca]|nr:PO21 protein [Erpornis zantholeuca]
IVTARLICACPISPRQRGFISASGCSENLKLLQLLIRYAKQEKKDLGVIFVDIAKAFDTVCHQHIIEGLFKRGIDPLIVSLVGDMYKDITTCVH